MAEGLGLLLNVALEVPQGEGVAQGLGERVRVTELVSVTESVEQEEGLAERERVAQAVEVTLGEPDTVEQALCVGECEGLALMLRVPLAQGELE